MNAESKTAIPRVELAPALPVTTEFSTLPMIRRAIVGHDEGHFNRAAILFERMCWNIRVRAAFDTRLAGLASTSIQWRPSQENRLARKAAKEIAEDWPFMAPTPQRKQMVRWGLGLGIAFAQRAEMASPTSRRKLFRLRPYWPGWANWIQAEDIYRVQARHGRYIDLKSSCESVLAADPYASPWIVHEPFGELSFREALIHALFRAFFGHEGSERDMGRASEKHGIGMAVLKFPEGANAVDVQNVARGFKYSGAEGVVPLPSRADEADGGKVPQWSLEPFEFTGGNGNELIFQSLNTFAIAFAIVILGHNLTTEVKGGSYAAADIGDHIRSDKKFEDGAGEDATYRPQLIQPWALVNYGDPEVAPIAHYIIDPPSVNKLRAETLFQLGQAISQFSAETGVNKRALCEQFQLPMNPETQVQVPSALPQAPVTPPAVAPAEEAPNG